MSAITEAIEDGRLQGKFLRAVENQNTAALVAIVGKLVERVEALEKLLQPKETAQGWHWPDKINPDDLIIGMVCEYFRIGPRDIMARVRTQSIAWPRQIVMYLLRRHTDWTLQEIGAVFKMDHGTVMHAYDRVTEAAQVEDGTRRMLEDFGAKIKSVFPPSPKGV